MAEEPREYDEYIDTFHPKEGYPEFLRITLEKFRNSQNKNLSRAGKVYNRIDANFKRIIDDISVVSHELHGTAIADTIKAMYDYFLDYHEDRNSEVEELVNVNKQFLLFISSLNKEIAAANYVIDYINLSSGMNDVKKAIQTYKGV